MFSFEAFCHKKDDPNTIIELLLAAEGFVQLPDEYESLILEGPSLYEGLASINGFNFLDAKNNSQIIENIAGCIIISPKHEEKIGKDNALLSNRLEIYSKKRGLSLQDTIFLQKVCLSLNAKFTQNSEYVYVNLKDCGNAPLVLDATRCFFNERDILFSLPSNLKFVMPLLLPKQSRENQQKEDDNLDLADGYRTFFDDVCGIVSPNFDALQKTKKKPARPKSEPSEAEEKTNDASKKGTYLKPGTKIAPSVKKDVMGNVAFSCLFTALSIASPYFYFTLLNEAANVYFVIYLILEIFFLLMSALPICYLKDAKTKLTRAWFYLLMGIIPIIIVLATLILLYISKEKGWLGTQCYIFLGLGFGYLLLYPLVHLLYSAHNKGKRKAKA